MTVGDDFADHAAISVGLGDDHVHIVMKNQVAGDRFRDASECQRLLRGVDAGRLIRCWTRRRSRIVIVSPSTVATSRPRRTVYASPTAAHAGTAPGAGSAPAINDMLASSTANREGAIVFLEVNETVDVRSVRRCKLRNTCRHKRRPDEAAFDMAFMSRSLGERWLTPPVRQVGQPMDSA